MKKLLFLFGLIISTSAYSQIGIKAGFTYNADEGLYKSAENTYTNKGKGNSGYHIGIYKRFDLTGLYVLPEVWYVNYKTEFEDAAGKNVDVKYKRIDVPVSIGTKVLGLARIQAGPVFSYYFEDDINLDKIKDIEQDDISVALQVGAGVSLQSLDLSVRYDFPLGKRETKWINNSDYKFTTENSPQLLHLSIGYNF